MRTYTEGQLIVIKAVHQVCNWALNAIVSPNVRTSHLLEWRDSLNICAEHLIRRFPYPTMPVEWHEVQYLITEIDNVTGYGH